MTNIIIYDGCEGKISALLKTSVVCWCMRFANVLFCSLAFRNFVFSFLSSCCKLSVVSVFLRLERTRILAQCLYFNNICNSTANVRFYLTPKQFITQLKILLLRLRNIENSYTNLYNSNYFHNLVNRTWSSSYFNVLTLFCCELKKHAKELCFIDCLPKQSRIFGINRNVLTVFAETFL